MRKVGIACDCHNTLINSNHAWVHAFVDYIGREKEDEIKFYLYGKHKRRELAKKYDVEFEKIEDRADNYEKQNDQLIRILYVAKEMNIPLFVVSNAPARRVLKDMRITGVIDLFDRIYTDEDGGKSNLQLYDRLLNDYNLEYLLFLGNEEFDDHIPHERVVSFALTSFLRDRCEIINGCRVDNSGKVVLDDGEER